MNFTLYRRNYVFNLVKLDKGFFFSLIQQCIYYLMNSFQQVNWFLVNRLPKERFHNLFLRESSFEINTSSHLTNTK